MAEDRGIGGADSPYDFATSSPNRTGPAAQLYCRKLGSAEHTQCRDGKVGCRSEAQYAEALIQMPLIGNAMKEQLVEVSSQEQINACVVL